jgi:hypothetical protein
MREQQPSIRSHRAPSARAIARQILSAKGPMTVREVARAAAGTISITGKPPTKSAIIVAIYSNKGKDFFSTSRGKWQCQSVRRTDGR